nr:PLP-dependent aminotransferase family protein [uncultured Deefgea sp.]
MLAKRIERLTSSLVRDILAVAQRPGVISFAGGLPADEALLQLDMNALSPDLLSKAMQYGPTEGERALREQVAQRMAKIGLNCSADQVLILNGSQQGIDLVSKLMIEEGTPVLVEEPAYLAALQSFRLFGADLKSVALQAPADMSAVDQVLGEVQLAYLTPSFQNPSGYCYSTTERMSIAALLDTHGVCLFEDDPYRELAYDTPAPAPMVSFIQSAPWIYQGSFSKTLAPGLRLGFLIAHPDLMPHLIRLKQAADLHSNRLSQLIVSQILAAGQLEPHLAQVLPIYRQRRDAMAAALQRHLTPYARWQVPAGGLFFWVRLHKVDDTLALMRQCLAQQLAIMPGVAFMASGRDEGYIRLNFSYAKPEQIELGITKLAQILQTFNAEKFDMAAGNR